MLELVNVVLAAAAGFAIGAVWYGVLSEQWMEAARIPRGPDGKPEGGMGPATMGLAFLCQLVVAGMMRHVFMLGGIDTVGKGLVAGAGIGLFIIAPWIALNNLFGMRPLRLSMIDGGYAALACTAIGLVLVLF